MHIQYIPAGEVTETDMRTEEDEENIADADDIKTHMQHSAPKRRSLRHVTHTDPGDLKSLKFQNSPGILR